MEQARASRPGRLFQAAVVPAAMRAIISSHAQAPAPRPPPTAAVGTALALVAASLAIVAAALAVVATVLVFVAGVVARTPPARAATGSPQLSGLSLLSARSAAMGGAYVAAADDLYAAFHNPAGLADVNFEASFAASAGSPDEATPVPRLLALIQEAFSRPDDPPPVRGRAGALGALALRGSAIALSADASVDVVPGPQGHTAAGQLVSTVTLASARRIPLGTWGASLALGSAVRLLHVRSLRIPPPGAESEADSSYLWTGQGFSLDLGAQLKLGDWFAVGAFARDLAGALTWAPSPRRALPSGSEANPWDAIRDGWAAGVAVGGLAAGVCVAGELRADGSWSVGFEQWLFDRLLAVRMGRRREADGQLAHSVGLGLRLGPFRADVAAVVPAGSVPVVGVANFGLRF